MARKPKTEREFSAGGVVVRGDEVAVIVPHKRSPEGKRVLALPKGHPDAGETMEQAAAREVREEAGVEGELVEKLGDVRYFYQRNGRRIFKIVSFFLFRYRSGDTADHDHEIEEARWMPLAEAAEQLSFRGRARNGRARPIQIGRGPIVSGARAGPQLLLRGLRRPAQKRPQNGHNSARRQVPQVPQEPGGPGHDRATSTRRARRSSTP